jgi:thiamine-phosphate pyrophosphorylase
MFMTDPVRTPDPLAVIAGLPRGSAVIYRAFGDPDALRIARALRAATRRRGVRLLIGADEGLAQASGADGLHLPSGSSTACPACERGALAGSSPPRPIRLARFSRPIAQAPTPCCCRPCSPAAARPPGGRWARSASPPWCVRWRRPCSL